MNASDLKQRIIIEKFTKSSVNKNGFSKDEWIFYYKCWCSYKCISWKEYFSAKAVKAENTVTFTVRYCNKIRELLDDKDATKKYRIIYRNKVYDIKSIIEVSPGFVDIKGEING